VVLARCLLSVELVKAEDDWLSCSDKTHNKL
jgi:hypothetical protein